MTDLGRNTFRHQQGSDVSLKSSQFAETAWLACVLRSIELTENPVEVSRAPSGIGRPA